jgi:hypothetical protein
MTPGPSAAVARVTIAVVLSFIRRLFHLLFQKPLTSLFTWLILAQ